MVVDIFTRYSFTRKTELDNFSCFFIGTKYFKYLRDIEQFCTMLFEANDITCLCIKKKINILLIFSFLLYFRRFLNVFAMVSNILK